MQFLLCVSFCDCESLWTECFEMSDWPLMRLEVRPLAVVSVFYFGEKHKDVRMYSALKTWKKGLLCLSES